MAGFAGHTIDTLAVALRGMPRQSPLYVRLPDGSLARVRYVRPVYVTSDGRALPLGAGDGQTYAITLELE